MKILKSEPALFGAVMQAAVLCASVFVFHWEAEQVAAATGFVLAVTALFIRQSVVPAAAVVDKAYQVGTKVAEDLTSTTVGAAGAVTGTAKGIITDAVGSVLGGI